MEDLTPGDEQLATPQEVRSAIQNLQNTDYSKLMIIAKHFAKSYRLKGTVSEPGDLLHRAIVKTIDGRRHWNRHSASSNTSTGSWKATLAMRPNELLVT